jgi:hypothetical protein
MGFTMPDPKKQPQRGAHGAVAAQPQPWASILPAESAQTPQATQPATESALQALLYSQPQPPPPHRPAPHAISLPGFGFKYFAQETPPADQQPQGDSSATSALELVYRARAIHADSEARAAWREQTQTLAGEAAADAWFQQFPASTVGGASRDSPRVHSALVPATCHTLMVASSSSRWGADGKESRLGSPYVQSLFPGHESHDAIPSDLAADLTDDYWAAPRLNNASPSSSTAEMTIPVSSGSALFISALAALRQRDILSAHEVRNAECVLVQRCAWLHTVFTGPWAPCNLPRVRALSLLSLPPSSSPLPYLRFRTRLRAQGKDMRY